MTNRIIILAICSILSISCEGQKNNNNNKNNTNMNNDKKIGIKIAGPDIEQYPELKAKLELTPNDTTVRLTFVNTSDKDVIINRNRFGGTKLNREVYFLDPIDDKPSFNFYRSSNKEDYIRLKPNEKLEMITDLSKYYNFYERKYDSLIISYLGTMELVDDDFKQIYRMQDGVEKPVVFMIRSNNVILKKKNY